MRIRRYTARGGFTLNELIIAMLFGAIMILGTLGFSYYSRLDVQKSDFHTTSVEIGELILNDWQAAGGISSYDPVESLAGQLNITPTENTISWLENTLGSYVVLHDGNTFYLTLSYRNSTDNEPKVINVVVDWIEQSRSWEGGDPRRFVKLSGYVTEYLEEESDDYNAI